MISAPTAVARPGVQCLTEVLLIGDQALEHAHAGGRSPSLGHLHARCGVDGGEEVGRVGEGNGLVCAEFGDCVVDGALSQTGDGMRAAIDEIG